MSHFVRVSLVRGDQALAAGIAVLVSFDISVSGARVDVRS